MNLLKAEPQKDRHVMDSRKSSKAIVLILPVIALMLYSAGSICACADGAPAGQREVRALWVVRTTLTTPDKISGMVRQAKDCGFNTLIVQVRGRGDAYYRSALEPRAEELKAMPDTFDPLAQVVDEAHRAGLKVHAWINMGFVSPAYALPPSPSHIVNRHPEWLMVHRSVACQLLKLSPKDPEYLKSLMRQVDQDKSEIEGLYGSYSVPEVKEHLYRIAMDITEHYDVDGIHLDYIRYASKSLDYNRTALERFKSRMDRMLGDGEKKVLESASAADPLVYTTAFPDRWAQFLQDQVTEVVERISVGAHARKPDALVSAAVLANDEIALSKCSQDWKLWLERGLLDVVCPMAYTKDTEVFRRQIERARSYSKGRRLWAGVGSYQIPIDSTIEKTGVARSLGADGFVLFSYDDMVRTSATNPQGDYIKLLRERLFNETSLSEGMRASAP